MNAGTLKILGAIVVALILLLVLVEFRGSEEPVASGEQLLPNIREQVEKIESIEVNSANLDEPLKLVRRSNDWAVENRNDYPADLSKIRGLLQALADARIVEVKTANPELHHRLGLQAPDVEGSKGYQVTLSGENIDVGIIVGNVARGSMRYVRKTSGDQAWLIDQNPALPTAANDWLLKELVDLKSSEVTRIAISHENGDTITVQRSEDDTDSFTVTNIPQGRELSYATVANNIASALSSLSFEDLRPAIPAERSAQTEFDTEAGLRLVFTSYAAEDDNWISLQAATTDSASEAATKNAADINARVEGWQYQLADHKFNLLNRQWQDILQELAEDEATEN